MSKLRRQVRGRGKVLRFCGNSLTRLTEVSSKTVVLVNCGRNKLNVIKEIRALTGLGLKEAMQLTDNTPSTLQSSVSSAEAEEIKKRFQSIGAVIEIK